MAETQSPPRDFAGLKALIAERATELPKRLTQIAAFALDLQGASGVLVDEAQPSAGARFQAMLLRSPATRIEGGADEILRNIIAERVLGLPKSY